MHNIHVDNLEEVEVALGLMEPCGMAGESGPYTLADAVEHYHRFHAEIAADESVRELHGNHVCGEAIYGNGGWNRYYLRMDGYIYFSSFHASESKVRDAEALGFRIN